MTAADVLYQDGFDRKAERRIIRKLDFVLLPFMTMFYLLSFLVSEVHLNFKRRKLSGVVIGFVGSVEHWYVQLSFAVAQANSSRRKCESSRSAERPRINGQAVPDMCHCNLRVRSQSPPLSSELIQSFINDSPYIAAELPSNLLLRRIGPNILMPTILALWGLICACQGECRRASVVIVLGVDLRITSGC